MAPSRDEARAMMVLANIDWSFDSPLYSRKRNTFLFDCRKHHWYPATFVPEIPYSLLELLSRPGDVVCDPFAGIGTTMLQALLLGRRPYGVERCRVAVEYVRSIWTLLDPRTDLNGVRAALLALRDRYNDQNSYVQEALESKEGFREQLRDWFNTETFKEIAFLIVESDRASHEGLRAATHVSLSATLKAVTAQDRGWGCIADNMRPKPEQLAKPRRALARFWRNCTVLLSDIEAARGSLSSESRDFFREADLAAHIKHGDCRQVTACKPGTVDLVVSSPPYPSMTDYATSQRLSYYLLDESPDGDFRSEIGARRRRTRRNTLEGYRKDMQEALRLLVQQMREGGYACLVMPTFSVDRANSQDRRRAVDQSLSELLEMGLSEVRRFERVLPARRRHHNQHWTSLERETIHVYRKDVP